MKETDVLNPVRTIKVMGEVFEVRELPWKDYLHVIREMTSTAFDLFGGSKISLGELSLDKDKLVSALSNQEDLLSYAIEKSTSIPKDKIEKLTAAEALLVVDTIAEMNLRPEIVSVGKRLAGRMADVFGVKNPLPEQSTVSSAPATPSTT